MFKIQSQPTIMNEMPPAPIEPSWSVIEFGRVDLQDQRLNQRLLHLSADFAAQPQAQIPQACGDWAATKGAYRFFENPKVEAARLLSPHQERTISRMTDHARVFAVQDTTYLNYTHHPATTGLGFIGSHEDGQVGLIMHSTLALTEEGEPLGILSQHIWAREEPEAELDAAARRKARRESPIEAKESGKWLTAVRATVARCPAGVDVVHVCDSEACHS